MESNKNNKQNFANAWFSWFAQFIIAYSYKINGSVMVNAIIIFYGHYNKQIGFQFFWRFFIHYKNCKIFFALSLSHLLPY